MAATLARKALGFRYLMNVIPLDASLVRVLMAGGERGVARAADILVQEVVSTLALLGVTRVSDLRADHVRLRPPQQ